MLESRIGSEQGSILLAETIVMHPEALSSSACIELFPAYIHVNSVTDRDNTRYIT